MRRACVTLGLLGLLLLAAMAQDLTPPDELASAPATSSAPATGPADSQPTTDESPETAPAGEPGFVPPTSGPARSSRFTSDSRDRSYVRDYTSRGRTRSSSGGGSSTGGRASRAPQPTSALASGTKATWQDYRLVTDRNIFSRDRRPPRGPTDFGPPRPPRPPQDSYLMLTGVAVQEAEQVAFFEDSRSGETLRVGIGQKVGGGLVTGINLDNVEYQAGGQARRVGLGETLSGQAPPVASAASESEPGTTATGPSGPGTPPVGGATSKPSESGGGDVLERMRLRRLSELR